MFPRNDTLAFDRLMSLLDTSLYHTFNETADGVIRLDDVYAAHHAFATLAKAGVSLGGTSWVDGALVYTSGIELNGPEVINLSWTHHLLPEGRAMADKVIVAPETAEFDPALLARPDLKPFYDESEDHFVFHDLDLTAHVPLGMFMSFHVAVLMDALLGCDGIDLSNLEAFMPELKPIAHDLDISVNGHPYRVLPAHAQPILEGTVDTTDLILMTALMLASEHTEVRKLNLVYDDESGHLTFEE